MNIIWIERIRERMQATGVTQNDIANALGCTRGAVGHYLAGRRKPSLEQLEVMARTLSVSPAWLQYGVEPMEVREASARYHTGSLAFQVSGDTVSGLSADPAKQHGVVNIPADCYALSVTGSELSPRMYEGDVLLINPIKPPSPGHQVYIRYCSGEAQVLTLISQDEEEVVLEPLLSKQSRMVRRRADIEILHTIVGILYRNS